MQAMSKPFSTLVSSHVSSPVARSKPGTPNTTISASRLLRLPQEIRDRIFGYLLDIRFVRFWGRSEYVPLSDGDTYVLLRSPWSLDTRILRTNHRIYQEASTVFYQTNLFIRVALFSPIVDFAEILLQEIAANVTLIGAELSKTQNCSQHAVDVNIFIRSGEEMKSQFLIPYTSLPNLVSFLSTLCNNAKGNQSPLSGIEIYVRNTYGIAEEAISQTLLEPWRKISNIAEVVVSWPSGPKEFLTSLKLDISRTSFDADAWLESVTSSKTNGLRAFENGVLESSIQFFEQALASIMNAYKDVSGNRRADMMAMEEDFSKAVARIRFDSEIGISMALVNLEDRFERAKRSAINAYHISCNTRGNNGEDSAHDPPNDAAWFLDSDRATALFCNGSADMALGQFQEAYANFEEAQRLNPHDPGIARAVLQAQRRLGD